MKPRKILESAKRPAIGMALAMALLGAPLLAPAVVRGPVLSLPVNSVMHSGVENIGFTGQVVVSSRIIDDPDFHGPTMLELTIDFSSVKGLGRSTGSRFVSEARTIVRRPLLAFEEVEAIFSYMPGTNVNQARSAKAVISMSFSPFTGVVLTTRIVPVPVDVPPRS